MNEPIIVDLGDGRSFVSTGDPVTDPIPPLPECGGGSEQEVAQFVNALWARAYEHRQPAHARLRQMDRYYRTLHYREDHMNAELEVTNFAFSNTEVVTALMNQQPLRPRPKPLHPMGEDKIRRLREFGFWWLNRSRASMVRANSTRTKAKHGCACLMLTMDPKTGFAFVINWSLYDFYPDPSGKDVPGCEYFVFAAPIATRRLRAMYPDKADRIIPDNYTSPAYEVNVVPDRALYRDQWSRHSLMQVSSTNAESTVPYRSSPQPQGSSALVPMYSGEEMQGSTTTFVLQTVVRDYSTRKCRYNGSVLIPTTPDDPEGPIELTDQVWEHDVPSCPSGWRLMTVTSNGTVLEEEPVDECWGGLPFVLDYHVRHDGRIDGIGEIDNVIPLNRSYNEQKNQLRRGARLACAPVLVAPLGSALKFKGPVDAGDVLEPKPAAASQLRWLDYDGPKAPLFEHLATEKEDIEIVSGVHKALQGIRPEGIETGVALKSLQGASAIRIEAKVPESNWAWAEILLKATRAMAKKLSLPVMFEATDGQFLSMNAQDFSGEYEFEIPNENTLDAQNQRKEDATLLFHTGVLTPDHLLEAYDWPDWARVAGEARQWLLQQKMAEAAAAAQAEGSNGKAPGKSSSNSSNGSSTSPVGAA